MPATRLDTLLRAHGLGRIDYLSIDVEGAERAARGALDGSLDFDAVDITALSIENSRPGRQSYADILAPGRLPAGRRAGLGRDLAPGVRAGAPFGTVTEPLAQLAPRRPPVPPAPREQVR